MAAMTGHRLAAALVGALALSGCARAAEAPRPTPSGAADTGTTPTAGPSESLLVTPATPVPTPTRCPTRGAAVIPDGSWSGPLTLRLARLAGVPATRSSGSGRMQVLVQGGQVVQGAWTVQWQAAGAGTTDSGEARVRLAAELAGTVHGAATAPDVHGAWTISGTVRVTSPVTASVPVARSGEGRATMAVRATGCDAVTGTFVLPTRQGYRLARLAGSALWVGRRAG